MKKSLFELDPNFKLPVVEGGLAWHNLSTLELEGLAWPEESDAFCRLPNHVQELVREPVWELSRRSAGVLARFFTDATQISARWTLRNETLGMDHMPATGVSGLDLYARDGNRWRWAGIGRATQFPDNETVLVPEIDNSSLAGSEREYLLYLPLYNGVSQLQIGIPENAKLRFEKRDQKPICVYGTSIVQGGCASRAGMAYPAILGRKLNCPIINLGFSGNGKAEIEIACLLAEIDAAVFVIDCLPNLDLAQVKERVKPLIQTLRIVRAQTPIILVENITYQMEWLNLLNAESSVSKNAALQEILKELKADEMQKLYCVNGADLLGNDGESTVDGVHPTDVGFMRMANVLEPILSKLLKQDMKQ